MEGKNILSALTCENNFITLSVNQGELPVDKLTHLQSCLSVLDQFQEPQIISKPVLNGNFSIFQHKFHMHLCLGD